MTANPGGSIVTDGKTTEGEEYQATSALGMVFTANPNATAGLSPRGIVLRGFGGSPVSLQNFFSGYADPATNGTFIQIGDSTYSAIGGATTQIFGARLLLGNGTSATDDDSVAIGTGASTMAAAGIAIGKGAATTGADALALGSGARATGDGDLAFGRNASASGGGLGAIAIGDGATAADRFGVALGQGATAGGYHNVAIGAGATTGTDLASMAIGAASSAIGNGAMSFGGSAYSNGNNALAIGNSSIALATKAVAIASDAVASADFATALGNASWAGEINAIAIGNGATATGANSISIGTGNLVSGARSGAIGDPTTVTGTGSYSLGNDNTVNADNAVAIGNNITIATGLDGTVAIGNNSTVASAVGTAGTTIGGTAYSFAGTAPTSTVSVGAPGAERTITNVAAGRLSGASTDAVNGSQLFATNTQVTVNSTAIANMVVNGTGIKYFHATSTLADSSATGTDSIAVGPGAVASGQGSIAQGSGATAGGGAFGFGGSIAIGTNAQAQTVSRGTTIAIGDNSLAKSNGAAGDSLAIGTGAQATATDATAIGAQTTASATNTIAIGNNSTSATVAGAVALGVDANATAQDAIALGRGATASDTNSVALGATATTSAPVASLGTVINGSTYSFAGTAPIGTVSLGTAGNERTLTNLAAGRLGATSTDAVNGSQLFATNQAITATTAQLTHYYSVNGGAVPQANYANDGATGANALAAGVGAQAGIDNAVALGAGSVSNRAVAPATGTIAAGLGFVPYNTSDKTLLGAVSLGNAGVNTYRQIIGVADGTQAQDAVTLRQLQGAVGSVSVTPTMYFHANSSAVDSLAIGADSVAVGPTTVVNGNNGIGIGNGAVIHAAAPGGTAIGQAAQVSLADGIALGTSAQANAIQGIAIGAGAQSTFLGSVALGAGSQTTTGAQLGYTAFGLSAVQNSAGEVSIGSAGAERKLTNLAAGSAATDAVNVSQLQALSDNSVRYDDAGKAGVTLGGAVSTDGGATGGTKVSNLARGAVNATSTDAVNGSQLFATNQNVVALGATLTSLGATVSTIAGDTSSSYTSANGGGIRYARTNETGLPPADAFAQAQGATALGYNAVASQANSVALGSNSTTAPAIATAGITLGGIGYNFAGAAPASTVSIGAPGAERTLTNVAAGRVSGASTDAVNGSQLFATNSAIAAIGSVAGNAVQYDDAGKTTATLGGPVSTNGGVTGGTRLSNLTQGAVNASSTDAVNGSQLYGVQQQITSINNGAGIKYFHSNSTAPDSVAAGRDSVAAGPQAVAVGVGAVAVGNGANARADGSVALGAGSVASRGAETYTGLYSGAANATAGTVSVGSAGAERSLGNVADGRQATDAVNLRQLTGAVQQANAYTDAQVTNLNAGRSGLFQVNNSSGLAAPLASGSNAVAGGAGAVASGADATALGNGAQASGTRSVAVGSGSVATRADTVSVGAAGAERQITNVAAGTADTDAANLGQVNQGLSSAVDQANRYTDQKVDALANQVRGIERQANAAAASAMAVAGLPQPIFAGRGMTSAAISGYQGESALAVGVSAVSDNGRWVYKLGGSLNSRGKGGAVVAAGFQW